VELGFRRVRKFYHHGVIDESAIRSGLMRSRPCWTSGGGGGLRRPRRFAAGRGGIMAVWRATGIARSTIGRALGDCAAARRPILTASAGLAGEAAGDPDRWQPARGSAARWSSRRPGAIRSRRCCDMQEPQQPVGKPARHGHAAAGAWCAKLLRQLDYSLQANRKTREDPTTPIATRSSTTSTIG